MHWRGCDGSEAAGERPATLLSLAVEGGDAGIRATEMRGGLEKLRGFPTGQF